MASEDASSRSFQVGQVIERDHSSTGNFGSWFSDRSILQLRIIIPREQSDSDEEERRRMSSNPHGVQITGDTSGNEDQVNEESDAMNDYVVKCDKETGTDGQEHTSDDVLNQQPSQVSTDMQSTLSPGVNSVNDGLSDSKCVKATMESILNLLEDIPVTTHGHSAHPASTSEASCSLQREGDSSPLAVCSEKQSHDSSLPLSSPATDSNNNDLFDLNTVCEANRKLYEEKERNRYLNYLRCPPRLIPLDGPMQTKLSESDSESDIESNTSIEEEPMTPGPPEAESSHFTFSREEEVTGYNKQDSDLDEQQNAQSIHSESSESEYSENEFEVDCILKKKVYRPTGQVYYYVKWKGYDVTESTWEPENNLIRCRESIELFEKLDKKRRRRARHRSKRNEKLATKKKHLSSRRTQASTIP